MPEGDTIFRAARTLQKALGGKTITEFRTVYPMLGDLTGLTVTQVEAVGKHCLMHLSNGHVLRTHMRMAGSWHIYRRGEKWKRGKYQERIFLAVADFEAVAFNVYDAELVKDLRRSVVAKLGPDLLKADFDPEEVLKRMRARASDPICDVVLNQRVMAGAGNVYKSEILFMTRVHPLTQVRELAEAKLREILALCQEHLANNVTDGAGEGIVTYHGMRRTTGRSDPSERTWVYGRPGLPCRECATPIQSMSLGKDVRRTYWCPQCQRRA